MEPACEFALVLVRRGCFVRNVGSVQATLDATLAYAMVKGQEQRFDHPDSRGDDCTMIALDEDLAAALWGGDPALPEAPIPVTPEVDLAHRMLLAGGDREAPDRHASLERALTIGAGLLAAVDAGRVASGRPQTAARRRALADEARQALAGDPDVSLVELGRTLSVSPHHLSRVFHTATGTTVARHRMRLRVRDALERLAGGERDLARLAADVGFSDQSHLCRVVRAETGSTPSALRVALAG
jgi:AraC-like DNA-binding protein